MMEHDPFKKHYIFRIAYLNISKEINKDSDTVDAFNTNFA